MLRKLGSRKLAAIRKRNAANRPATGLLAMTATQASRPQSNGSVEIANVNAASASLPVPDKLR